MTYGITHNTLRSIKSAIRGSGNNWLRATLADSDLFIILAFCAVGLLVSLNLMFRFPDFWNSTEQFTQFLG
jgi:hypothetical protein